MIRDWIPLRKKAATLLKARLYTNYSARLGRGAHSRAATGARRAGSKGHVGIDIASAHVRFDAEREHQN